MQHRFEVPQEVFMDLLGMKPVLHVRRNTNTLQQSGTSKSHHPHITQKRMASLKKKIKNGENREKHSTEMRGAIAWILYPPQHEYLHSSTATRHGRR